MLDTAPDAGAVATDPYPGFVEEIVDDEPSPAGATPATPPAAPDAGTPAPADAAAQPVVPAVPAQPPTPASSAPSPAVPPMPAAPATPAAWDFQADRQTVTVPGSKVRDDGWLEVPPDQRALLENLLAEGVAHRGSWRAEQQRYEARIAELEEQSTASPEILRAKAFNDALLALLDKGPEAVAAWLDEYRLNFPLLKQQAEAAVLQSRLTTAEQRLAAREEDQEASELAPQLAGMISDTLQQVIASDPAYAGVDAQALEQRIRTRFLDQVAYEVDPKERPRGLASGEILLGRSRDGKTLYVFNAGLVADEVAYQASLRGGAASAAAAAVARNTAIAPAVPGAPGGAPPVVPAGSGTPGPAPAKPLPKTKEDVQRWIDSGDWKQSFPSA